MSEAWVSAHPNSSTELQNKLDECIYHDKCSVEKYHVLVSNNCTGDADTCLAQARQMQSNLTKVGMDDVSTNFSTVHGSQNKVLLCNNDKCDMYQVKGVVQSLKEQSNGQPSIVNSVVQEQSSQPSIIEMHMIEKPIDDFNNALNGLNDNEIQELIRCSPNNLSNTNLSNTSLSNTNLSNTTCPNKIRTKKKLEFQGIGSEWDPLTSSDVLDQSNIVENIRSTEFNFDNMTQNPRSNINTGLSGTNKELLNGSNSAAGGYTYYTIQDKQGHFVYKIQYT
jgi:hypothetical protein